MTTINGTIDAAREHSAEGDCEGSMEASREPCGYLPPPHTQARLALADGSVFTGRAFGAVEPSRTVEAEVVFNTALSGYQESLTDPSYAGQILVQTAPMIGNTGVNAEDVESGKVQVSGFVVHELTRRASNFRSTGELSAYLAEHGVLGIAGVDTRALTRRIRSAGAVPGVLTSSTNLSDADLVAKARSTPSMEGRELVSGVARREACDWDHPLGAWRPAATGTVPAGARPLQVIAIDCGAKNNILRHLVERGCSVKLVPFSTPANELMAYFAPDAEGGPADGLFISNGPGDPSTVTATISALREVILAPETRPATFGICLGHQLLAQAIGASTFKLPFGHRGTNQPVRHDETGRVSITSQNHGFAVDRASVEAAGGEITHTHLNDGTVAGFRLKNRPAGRPVFSVQYHPEASVQVR
ncbi:MAG: glutamine-hydrolyzing carbamoyl-phosphate synthase small subunit [Planctomycetota bacterium]